MTIKRLVAAALVCGLGFALGSCSSFSDFVSDHWPHFAGGEPNGLPPRPGDPGYNTFIAHGQPQQTVTNPTSGGADQPPSAFTEQPPQNEQPAVQAAPASAHPSNNPGGLY
jgi:hypothetical protein